MMRPGLIVAMLFSLLAGALAPAAQAECITDLPAKAGADAERLLGSVRIYFRVHRLGNGTVPALEAMYRFVVWLVPALDLEQLTEATYTRARDKLLAAANLGLKKQRLLIRLAHVLKHLDARRYAFAARAINDDGGLVGAWIKTHRAVAEAG